tara:strand:- start:465 stop:1052 length:588 start_codon:yes stop_codon:yes gene_type:complete
MKKTLIVIIALIFSITSSQAACDFLINIGDKGTKLYEKFDMFPMPMFKGQFMLPIQSTELCPNDNLNINITVEYVFLGNKDDESEDEFKNANLAAIRMVVFNDENNTESNNLTLMNYAKKVYGDFDTGINPKIFNKYAIFETGQSIVIYKRFYNEEGIIDEEIYITNIEYDKKLGEFYNALEEEEAATESNGETN